MTPEGRVKEQIKRMLKARPGLWYHFVGNNGFGNSGCPDILICYRGRFLSVEVKAESTKLPTALQRKAMDQISDAGGIALVIHKDNLDVLQTMLTFIEVDSK